MENLQKKEVCPMQSRTFGFTKYISVGGEMRKALDRFVVTQQCPRPLRKSLAKTGSLL